MQYDVRRHMNYREQKLLIYFGLAWAHGNVDGTCRGILVVEGGAGGGVQIDLLSGGGGVAADDGMARHAGHALDEVCRGAPAEPGGGGHAAPLVLVVFKPIHLFVHLHGEGGNYISIRGIDVQLSDRCIFFLVT